MKWLLASLVLASSAMGEPDLGGCADVFSDCHDNCSLKFGASQKDRIKLNTCINKCTTVEQDCRDRYLETQVHQLDEGALKNANSRPNDDLREDNKKVDIVSDGSKDKATKKKESPQREEDLPKRTSTRAADLDPKPAPKADTTTASTTSTAPAPAPAPSSSEPAAQKRSGLDSSVRDEDDKAKGDASKKKKVDADTAPSSSKKKRSALDEWDPEAL